MSVLSHKCGVIFLLSLLVCWPTTQLTAEEKTKNTGQQVASDAGEGFISSFSLTARKEPIRVRSQGLEFFYDEKRIVYRGDVVATQGDETLKSKILTVTYEDVPAKNGNSSQKTGEGSFNGRQQLKEIIAEGDVEIISGNRRATGKKAVFTEATRTVVLSGNAVLQEGQNQVSGERVTIFLDEKRSVVDGGAQMVFVPEQTKREQ
jgi:lipopolysaccharide export system protein LptA